MATAIPTRLTSPLPRRAVDAMSRLESALAAPAPAPHLGALLVDYDPGLGLGPSHLPLHEVLVGKQIETTATITTVKPFPGRTRMILDDGHGGAANVVIDSHVLADAFRAASVRPRAGVRVTVRGTVAQPPAPGAPRGISACSIRVVA